MQEYLHSHFVSEVYNAFLEEVSITLIEKTDGSDPTKKKKLFGYIRLNH